MKSRTTQRKPKLTLKQSNQKPRTFVWGFFMKPNYTHITSRPVNRGKRYKAYLLESDPHTKIFAAAHKIKL